jgi:prepilin-type N-terminal cleavage/methylation domain-containing protein
MSGPSIARRRGVTLIELLVAMAITGLVATFVMGWIAHASRQAAASQRRDDREQELALLRNELFQDGSRGRTLELGKARWKLVRDRNGSEPDTVEWRIESDGLRRSGSQKLSHDALLEGSMEPHFTDMAPDRDAWTLADLDFDGLVDAEFLPRLDRLHLALVVRRAALPGSPPLLDTLRFAVPLLGPG